jgi:hypothetical protein
VARYGKVREEEMLPARQCVHPCEHARITNSPVTVES